MIRTFEGRLAALLAPAREDKLPGVHAREVLRRLEADAIISARDNDILPLQIHFDDGRHGIVLFLDELVELELHVGSVY